MRLSQADRSRARRTELTEDEPSLAELSQKEEEFQIKQSIIRAEKRISENRGMPFDFIISVIRCPDSLSSKQAIPPPAQLISSLSSEELQEVRTDIPTSDAPFKDYWDSLVVLVDHQLDIISGRVEDDGAIHSTVLPDVDALLAKKSTEDLLRLELGIQSSMSHGQVIDEEYWLSVLRRLRIFKASVKTDEIHREMVIKRLALALREGLPESELEALKTSFFVWEKKPEPEKPVKPVKPTEPVAPIPASFINKPTAIGRRRRVITDEELYQAEEDLGEADDEEPFNREFEMSLEGVDPSLKKPRYYNRVRSEIDWNKHNTAKYTPDNPPPKTTLGYKFNIFYPDWADTSQSPTYKILQTENPDMVVIVFKGAPPYRDIAFKVVNSEWEYSQKKGYKCDFSSGVLHLHFNFKRYKYRR